MGTTSSTAYNFMRRLVNRYNASNRALKVIDSDKLPRAPSYSPALDTEKILENNPELRKELEGLKIKDKSLDEYLKKVYLTSTSKNFSFDTKKPLPTKQIRTVAFYLKDMECQPGYCTLEEISEMLTLHGGDSKKWSPTAIAEKFKVDKSAVINILMYYSFFKKEDFDFIKSAPDETIQEGKIEFETFTQLEKKPVKLIEGKKSK